MVTRMMLIMVLVTTDLIRTPTTMIIGLIPTPNGTSTKNEKKKGEKEAPKEREEKVSIYHQLIMKQSVAAPIARHV